jgi:hypothetical protein
LSNYCLQIAAVIVINIVIVGGGGDIIAIAIAIVITIVIAVSAVPSLPSLSTLVCHHHCCPAPWQPIGGNGQNKVTAALPMACGRIDCPWIGYGGGKAMLGGH